MSEVTKPVFTYLFEEQGRVATLAYTIYLSEGLGEPEGSYVAYLGYAICAPEDQHHKKLGRTIARGRMENPACQIMVPLGKLTNRRERLGAIVDFLAVLDNVKDFKGGRLLCRVAKDDKEFREWAAGTGCFQNFVFPDTLMF